MPLPFGEVPERAACAVKLGATDAREVGFQPGSYKSAMIAWHTLVSGNDAQDRA